MRTTILFVGDDKGLRSATPHDGRRTSSVLDPVFGQDMRRRRRALDLSQIDIGELLGLHQITISRLENGKVPLTNETRSAIDQLLTELES